jgi:magnesium chelatase accessory protein
VETLHRTYGAPGSPRPLDWARDSHGWPHREHSRFVEAGGLRWHVQRMGPHDVNAVLPASTPTATSIETATATATATVPPPAPLALLLHGTGASTHSWRGLMPRLAAQFDVVAMDLPGHGFTSATAAQRMSLPGMAAAVGSLLVALKLAPQLVVGHSAGAAIAVRMALDGLIAPAALLSLNGALLPLPGLPGLLFPPAAKVMAALPFVPQLFAWRAGDAASVLRLIDGTGSTLDAAGVELYARLLRSPGHAAGALAMMANWDLARLEADMARLQVPLTLIVGANDRAVPPRQARRVQALVAGAHLVTLAGLGHLAHEEQPERVADEVLRAAQRVGLLPR